MSFSRVMPLNSDRLIQALTLFRMIQFGSLEKNTYICSMEIKEKVEFILKGEDELIKMRKHKTAKSFLELLGIPYVDVDIDGGMAISVDAGMLSKEQLEAVKMIIEWKNK